MAELSVDELTPSDHEAYDRFVRDSRGGLVYYSSWYKDVLEGVLSPVASYLVARRGDEIRGVFPCMTAQGDLGAVVNSLPFYGSHGGPLALDEEARMALMRGYAQVVEETHAVSATIVGNPLAPAQAEGARCNAQDRRIGQITPLPSDANAREELLGMISKPRRTEIRKNERFGTIVERDHSMLGFVEEQHVENMKRLGGTSKPHGFFTSLSARLEPGQDYEVFVARLDGEPVAALLVLYFGETAEYFVPVTKEEQRQLAPMSAVLLEAMTDAARRGLRWWNWGGTWMTQEGVYRYKAQWGARDHPYDYFVQVRDPEILMEPASRLSATYPWFYVAPFEMLGRPSMLAERIVSPS